MRLRTSRRPCARVIAQGEAWPSHCMSMRPYTPSASEFGAAAKKSAFDEVVARRDAPQAMPYERHAVDAHQLADEHAAVRIEGVDRAVAEIADENVVAERAEVARRLRLSSPLNGRARRLIPSAVAGIDPKRVSARRLVPSIPSARPSRRSSNE